MRGLTGLDKVYRRLLAVTNPVLVPLGNRAAHRAAQREPDGFAAQLDAAVARGVHYFEAQPHLEMVALFAFSRIADHTVVSELAFVQARLAEYRDTYCDPHLRLCDPAYDPEHAGAEKPPGPAPANAGEQLMLECLYADRTANDEQLLERVKALDDGGGYGTTHVLMGCAILAEFSDLARERLAPLLDTAAASLCRAQRWDRMSDLYAERVALLEWQDYHQCIMPAWITRIVRAQLPDGGWFRKPTLAARISTQHTSSLALAALLRYRAGTGGHAVLGQSQC